MALAPIAGPHILAPFRITAVYLPGNAVMQEDRFDSTVARAPASASPLR